MLAYFARRNPRPLPVMSVFSASRILRCGLLGLFLGVASLAHAQGPYFRRAHPWEDPFRGPLIKNANGMAFADLNGDGALEAYFFGNQLYVVEHTAQGFDWPRLVNAADGGDEGGAFLDMDGDGDLDLLSHQSFGGPNYYRAYTGTGFERRPSPFAGLLQGRIFGVATGDVDGDGLPDIVVGVQLPGDYPTRVGRLYLFTQTGPGAFALRTGGEDPFASLVLPGEFGPSPALADADGDGDTDLLVTCYWWGSHLDTCQGRPRWYYEQASPGVFVERTGADDPFAGIGSDVGGHSTSLVDLDGDGELDAFITDDTGALLHYESTPTGFVRRDNPYEAFNGFGFRSANYYYDLNDIDGDGDEDLVAGTGDLNVGATPEHGRVEFYERTSSATEPFVRSSANPLADIDFGNCNVFPLLDDVDGDGDSDLVVQCGVSWRYFEQTSLGVLTERTGSANPFMDVVAGGVRPDLGDVDEDGDLDLVVLSGSEFEFYEQVDGNEFVLRTDQSLNPFWGLDAYNCGGMFGHGPVFLVDLDHDGDLDMSTSVCFYQNIGGSFFGVYPDGNPLVGFNGSVDLIRDIDMDGYVDVVAPRFTYINTRAPVAVEDAPGASAPPYHLSEPSPNPAAATARLTLAVAEGQRVRAALHDVLGRELALLYEGPVAAGVPLALTLDTSALPAGVYVVRVEGAAFTASRRVTVAR